jgi:hypothetical protein
MAVEDEQRDLADQLRQHLAVSLHSVKEEVELHQKNATRQCQSVQESLQSFQNPWATSRPWRCQHQTVHWEFVHGVGAFSGLLADCSSARWAELGALWH